LIKHKYYDYVFYRGGLINSIVGKEYANKGYRVLILERNKEFGIPRKCGNYIEKSYLKKLGLEENPQLIQTEINEIVYFNELNEELQKLNINLFIIDPRIFEKNLIMNSTIAGVDIKPFSRIYDLEEENNSIKSIYLKSFRDEKKVAIKTLISQHSIGREIASNKNLDSNLIINTIQYELFSNDFKNLDYCMIYKIQTNNILIIFPSIRGIFNLWMIGFNNRVNLKNYLQTFLKINNFNIISINTQRFLKSIPHFNNLYSNHILLPVELGLINPLKSHYLMTEIDFSIFMSKFLPFQDIFFHRIYKDFKYLWTI